MAPQGGAATVPTVPAPFTHATLLAFALLPLVLPVPANANVILMACLTVFAGCWRSVKPAPPEEAMTKKVRAAAGALGAVVVAHRGSACAMCIGGWWGLRLR